MAVCSRARTRRYTEWNCNELLTVRKRLGRLLPMECCNVRVLVRSFVPSSPLLYLTAKQRARYVTFVIYIYFPFSILCVSNKHADNKNPRTDHKASDQIKLCCDTGYVNTISFQKATRHAKRRR